MTGPTCSTCTHWHPQPEHETDDRGDCAFVGVSVRIGFWPGAARTFVTPADFGCSHHSDGWAAPAAAARRGDPDTSHEAARTIDRLNERRTAVLRVLDQPLTDVRLVQEYTGHAFRADLAGSPLPAQAPSGIRSRRHELVQLGLVAHVDTVRIGGRRHRVWARTPAGDRAARTGAPA